MTIVDSKSNITSEWASPKTPKTPRTPRTKDLQETTMPSPTETWKTFGDLHSRSILQAATNNDEYRNVTAQFHARLFLIVRGLSVDELHNMFSQTLPSYIIDGAARSASMRVGSLRTATQWCRIEWWSASAPTPRCGYKARLAASTREIHPRQVSLMHSSRYCDVSGAGLQ